MFLGWIYRYIIATAIALIILGYNIYCFLGLIKLGRAVSKKEIESSENMKPKGNIYIWLLKKTLSKNKKPKGIKLKIKIKLAKRINIGVVIISLGVLVINISLIAAIYILNIQATNIANVLTTIFGDKDCVCYAKCTGNEEDDTKTAYELLFGPDEYKKLYESIAVTPTEKQPFLDMHTNNPNGKTEGEWLITHIDDNAVQCYKAIVGNNNKFRSGDHKDRSNMTNGELREDLIALLSDYKIDGRNPNCPSCTGTTEQSLGRKCLGEAHYVEGWTWEAIWDNDGNTDDEGGDFGGVGSNNAENSPYGINLGDGWYYWYQQAHCTCAHNVNHPTYGQYSYVLLYTPNKNSDANTAKSRGCSTYSTAMAVSNVLGKEVTPYNILLDVLGGTLTQCNDGSWLFGNATNYINLSVAPPEMNKQTLVTRLEEVYSSQGLRAKYISGMSSRQSEVDEILAKGGCIVASWGAGMPWYNGKNTHFMVIRKKDSNGNYYCLDSNINDTKAVERMTTPATWSQLMSTLRHDDCYGVWNVNPPSSGGGGEGGIIDTPPVIDDPDILDDIKKGLYTEEDYNYLVALGGESSSYEGFYAVACSVRNRVQQGGSSYKAVVTASNQYSGFNQSEVGHPRNENVKRAAVAVLRGGPSTVGSCRNFFGRVSGYDMWAEPTVTEFYNVGGNIFYGTFGEVHNKKSNKTPGAIIIWSSSERKWYYPSGTCYHK